MGFENVGRVWTTRTLAQYLSAIRNPDRWTAVTLHHTFDPSLAVRPNGFRITHIQNIRDHYIKEREWNTGPHIFIDEDQIFGMCDLRKKGRHASSFNDSAIGIEVLGNYDEGAEDPLTGRGLACWQNAAATVRVLLDWLRLDANQDTVLFHRDDPLTKKSCPGIKIKKDWVISLIKTPITPHPPLPEKPDVGIPWSNWEFQGECWCVPIHNFFVAKGIPSATVISKLKSRGGKFYYDGELIEGAYYVKAGSSLEPNECTWAPAYELMEFLRIRL